MWIQSWPRSLNFLARGKTKRENPIQRTRPFFQRKKNVVSHAGSEHFLTPVMVAWEAMNPRWTFECSRILWCRHAGQRNFTGVFCGLRLLKAITLILTVMRYYRPKMQPVNCGTGFGLGTFGLRRGLTLQVTSR